MNIKKIILYIIKIRGIIPEVQRTKKIVLNSFRLVYKKKKINKTLIWKIPDLKLSLEEKSRVLFVTQ